MAQIIFSAVLIIFIAWNFLIAWINSNYVEEARKFGVSARGTYFVLIDYRDPKCPEYLRAKIKSLLKVSLAVNAVLILAFFAIAKIDPL